MKLLDREENGGVLIDNWVYGLVRICVFMKIAGMRPDSALGSSRVLCKALAGKVVYSCHGKPARVVVGSPYSHCNIIVPVLITCFLTALSISTVYFWVLHMDRKLLVSIFPIIVPFYMSTVPDLVFVNYLLKDFVQTSSLHSGIYLRLNGI